MQQSQSTRQSQSTKRTQHRWWIGRQVLSDSARLSLGRGWLWCLIGLTLVCGSLFFTPNVEGRSVEGEDSRRLRIVTTIAQIGEPLTVITAGRADVQTLMGVGVDPHLYRPTTTDITALLEADAVLWVGRELEAQLQRPLQHLHLRPASRLGDESDPVLSLAQSVKERDGDVLLVPGKAIDPHMWMDPLLWAQALDAAVEHLASKDKKNAAFYRARWLDYRDLLVALDEDIQRSVNTLKADQRVVVTAHDAFAYFGRRYGLEVIGLQGLSTESEAGLQRIEEIVQKIVDCRISAVFAESSVNHRHVYALIEGSGYQGHDVVLGGILYSDAMGAEDTNAGTYIGMMVHNARTIVQGLGGIPSMRLDLAQGDLHMSDRRG